jgi:endonuclease/exonuclease/phosphatase (EEP) superfamily protein YafD
MKKVVALIFVVACASDAFAQQPLKVLTLNTSHGGQAPFSVDDQIAAIAAESPDVVLLQEAHRAQLDLYVKRLNDALGTTAWHGAAAQHCVAGDSERCTSYTEESVMVLSRAPFDETESRLVWARDAYFAARAVLRAALRLDNGTVVQLFGCHLPPLSNATDQRNAWVAEFRRWTDPMSGPRIAGGDFNDSPASSPIAAMTERYADAWAAKGSGGGATHGKGDGAFTTRIDYLFSAGVTVNAASVPDVSVSDHRPVVALYTVPSGAAASGTPPAIPMAAPTPALASPNGETVLTEDDFDSDLPDVAKWPAGIVSGTEDRAVPVAQTGGAIAIGPLFANASGFHCNGPSSPAFDLSSGGYAQVQLVQAVVGDQANAMFTAANGSTNLYRIYETGAAGAQRIAVEKKIADVKYPLASVAYDPAVHQLLRIRHDWRPSIGVDDVVFETAAVTAAGAPFVEMYREPWDASIQADRLAFEIKAGTSDKESAPGVAVWDNFRVALQPISEP